MNRKDLKLVKSAKLRADRITGRVYTQHRATRLFPAPPGISDLLEPDKRYRPGQGFHAGKYYFDAQWYEPHEFPGMIHFLTAHRA